MGLFSLFSKGNKIAELKAKDAIVVDVRTPGEFASGHIKGSKNFPLQSFNSKLKTIQAWDKPVILCCASGMRSAQATNMLKKLGVECVNGGGWRSLSRHF